jgi:hypothetical protein
VLHLRRRLRSSICRYAFEHQIAEKQQNFAKMIAASQAHSLMTNCGVSQTVFLFKATFLRRCLLQLGRPCHFSLSVLALLLCASIIARSVICECIFVTF